MLQIYHNSSLREEGGAAGQTKKKSEKSGTSYRAKKKPHGPAAERVKTDGKGPARGEKSLETNHKKINSRRSERTNCRTNRNHSKKTLYTRWSEVNQVKKDNFPFAKEMNKKKQNLMWGPSKIW